MEVEVEVEAAEAPLQAGLTALPSAPTSKLVQPVPAVQRCYLLIGSSPTPDASALRQPWKTAVDLPQPHLFPKKSKSPDRP